MPDANAPGELAAALTRLPNASAAGPSTGLLRPIARAACLALLVAGCTDPRPRPVGPTVQVLVTPRTVVTSPGTLTGTIDVYDANGLDSVRVRAELGNGSTVADSTFFPSGSDPFSLALPLLLQLPGGLPQRTEVRIVARARSFIGFVAADTLRTAVGDTL